MHVLLRQPEYDVVTFERMGRRLMADEVRFDPRAHPTVTIAKVLIEHHPFGSAPGACVCYCGFGETRREAFTASADGLDLHRAEVLWGTFRIEDA